MLELLSNQIMFFIALTIVLFIPGYFFILAFFGKKETFSDIEKFTASVSLSIIIVGFIMISIGKMGIPLTRISIISAILLFCAICGYAYHLRNKNHNFPAKIQKSPILTRKQVLLFILLISISMFIRSASLKNSINPSATDLAHHTYWIKLIKDSGKLPEYQKRDIIKENEQYSIGEPAKIDDFIIGEHLIFSAILIISGIDPISPFISLTLFLINTATLLAIFILTQTLFRDFSWANIAGLFSLLFLGPIFALSSSQANFISGGVIGNLIGNLLIATALYFYVRALFEKNKIFLSFALLTTFGLAYTHHLSTFIFIFILFGSILGLIIAAPKKALLDTKEFFRMFLTPNVLSFLAFFIIFFFFILMPDYIKNDAVKTIIGEPSRSTKEGLSISRIVQLAGDVRISFGIFGIFILLLMRKSFRYPFALLFGWLFTILIMSWKPTLVMINIPSVRIANYIIFPLIVLASFGISWLFHGIAKDQSSRSVLKKNWAIALFAIFIVFIFSMGYKNNSNSLKTSPNIKSTILTFNAAEYLKERIDANDLVIKDHNYISSDAWMKIFFMRDYNFPLTRSFFFRYEDSKSREQCTNYMITKPNTSDGERCFEQLGVNFVMVSPNDSMQFEKSQKFWPVYYSDTIKTYYKK